jgi:membrane fusion protein, multidrug efflux system
MMATTVRPRCSAHALARSLAMAAVLTLAGSGCKREQGGGQAMPMMVQLAPEDLVVAQSARIEDGPLVSGTLEAAYSATVRAQLGGTVQQIGPELGQTVQRGMLLARIDARGLGDAAGSARAQVTAAQAQLEVARRETERSRALVDAGAIARRDLEQAESRATAQRAAVDQARAQLATAAKQLGDATVRAPMAGVVAQRTVNTGDVVAAGATLYQIIDPSSVRLSASVPSDQLGDVAIGHKVRFTVHGYPEETFTGSVTRIAPTADPVTKQIAILVDLPNPAHRLLTGLFARGRIVSRAASGLAVPSTAVDTRSDKPAVLRLTGSKLERVPVTLGLRDPARDLVLINGVRAGDRVLARPAAAPPPEALVAPPPATAPATSSAAPPAGTPPPSNTPPTPAS